MTKIGPGRKPPLHQSESRTADFTMAVVKVLRRDSDISYDQIKGLSLEQLLSLRRHREYVSMEMCDHQYTDEEREVIQWNNLALFCRLIAAMRSR